MAAETEVKIGGLEGKSAIDVFNAARTASQNSTANPGPIPCGVYCPICREKGQPNIPVIADRNRIRCNQGHSFDDTDDLMGRKPDKMPLKQKETKQEGYVPVNFSIPKDAHDALVKKYGADRLGAALSSMMMALTEDNSLYVTQVDLDEMTNRCFGKRPASSQELKGLVINLYLEKKNALDEASAKTAQSSEGNSTGVRLRPREYVIGLTRDAEKKLQEMHDERGKPKETILEEGLEQALENNWI